MGSSRPDDLRPRRRGTAALCAKTRRSPKSKQLKVCGCCGGGIDIALTSLRSTRQEQPKIEIKDHCRIVVVTPFEWEVRTKTILGRDPPHPEWPDIFPGREL